MRYLLILFIGLMLPFSGAQANDAWEGYDYGEGRSVWIDEDQRPVYEGEEYEVYHESDGTIRYETILLKDGDAVETFDPDRGEYNIYYSDDRSGQPIRQQP